MNNEYTKRKVPKQEAQQLITQKITHVLIYAVMQEVDQETNNIRAIRVDGMFGSTTEQQINQYHQNLVDQGTFQGIPQHIYRFFWELPEPISISEFDRDQIMNKFIEWSTQQAESEHEASR